MANRYIVASGNWNSTSIWSSTSGGSSGASAPVAGDAVYINANYTVTLSANAACSQIYHTAGTLNLSSYTLTVGDGTQPFGSGRIQSSGTTSRTINLGSGNLIINTNGYGGMLLSGSNLTFTPGTSFVEMNVYYTEAFDFNYAYFTTAGKTFNDVRINLGVSDSGSYEAYIGGPGVFHMLDIRAANSASHKVTFDSFYVTVTKFIALGASTSNRLELASTWVGEFNENSKIDFATGGTCYGQYVNLNGLNNNSATVYGYMGDGSIISSPGGTGGINFLLSNPPKIDSVVDPFITPAGDNPNWSSLNYQSISYLTSGVAGGGYRITNMTSPSIYYLLSSNTYDLTDSWIYLYAENLANYRGGPQLHFDRTPVDDYLLDDFYGISVGYSYDPGMGYNSLKINLPKTNYLSAVAEVSGGYFATKGAAIKFNSDGSVEAKLLNSSGTWLTMPFASTPTVHSSDIALLKSVRVIAGFNGGHNTGGSVSGDILSLNIVDTEGIVNGYFDGHVSISDPNNVWSNEINAFDDNESTYAQSSGVSPP